MTALRLLMIWRDTNECFPLWYYSTIHFYLASIIRSIEDEKSMIFQYNEEHMGMSQHWTRLILVGCTGEENALTNLLNLNIWVDIFYQWIHICIHTEFIMTQLIQFVIVKCTYTYVVSSKNEWAYHNHEIVYQGGGVKIK